MVATERGLAGDAQVAAAPITDDVEATVTLRLRLRGLESVEGWAVAELVESIVGVALAEQLPGSRTLGKTKAVRIERVPRREEVIP
jgi:hypothetical protein